MKVLQPTILLDSVYTTILSEMKDTTFHSRHIKLTQWCLQKPLVLQPNTHMHNKECKLCSPPQQQMTSHAGVLWVKVTQ